MDKNKLFGDFLCTEAELQELTQIKADVLSKNMASTVKQAEKLSLKLFKEKHKQAKQASDVQDAALISKKKAYFETLDVQTDEKGNPLALPKNIINVMTNLTDVCLEGNTEPVFKRLWLDEFSEQIYYGDAMITDFDKSIITNRMSNIFKQSISAQKITDAINEIAFNNKENIVKKYLESLTWDGTSRVDTFFTDFLGAKDSPLYREYARMFLGNAVRRIYEPGCKFDNMIIFAGPQGIGKSTICQKLAVRAEWYCDNLPLGEKDAYDKIRSSWIVNMDEITSLNKKDSATAKNFLTGTFDKHRKAYGTYENTYKRHCVFIGTTNEDKFLKDSTSLTERRFWVVQCSGTRSDGIEAIKRLTPEYVDSLWAEALVLYKSGKINSYISDNVWKDFVSEQKQYKLDSTSELFLFLEDVLDRKYVDFVDDSSLSDQFRAHGAYAGNMVVQNRFSVNAINNLLRQQKIYFSRGYLKMYAELHSEEWEYGVFKQNGKSVRGIIRKNPVEPDNKMSDIFNPS